MQSPVEIYDQEELLFEKNALVHSRQTFSLLQQRILALAGKGIKRSDDPFKTYIVKIRDLVNLGTSDNIYSRLEKETRDLTEKAVTLKVKDGKYESFEHWTVVAKAKHVKGSGTLEIQFHPEIRDMLFFDLNDGEWSSYFSVELVSCTSVYSIRIMKMLLSYWRKGEWRVSVKELRRRLGLEDKYKSFTNFRKRVLGKAQRDLQKNTSMRFTWEEEKNAQGRGKGRKITHIKFDFSWKPDQMKLPIEEPEQFDIWNLRRRLKNRANLPTKKIDEVLSWLKKNEALRDGFKQKFAPVSACIQQGTDEAGNPIKSLSGFASSRLKQIMEAVESEATAPVKSAFNGSLFDQDVPGHDEANPFNHMKEKLNKS